MEEVYYVVSGSGRVVVGDETVEIHPRAPQRSALFFEYGPADLELMIFGISTAKNAVDTQLGSPEQPTWLQVSPKK